MKKKNKNGIVFRLTNRKVMCIIPVEGTNVGELSLKNELRTLFKDGQLKSRAACSLDGTTKVYFIFTAEYMLDEEYVLKSVYDVIGKLSKKYRSRYKLPF